MVKAQSTQTELLYSSLGFSYYASHPLPWNVVFYIPQTTLLYLFYRIPAMHIIRTKYYIIITYDYWLVLQIPKWKVEHWTSQVEPRYSKLLVNGKKNIFVIESDHCIFPCLDHALYITHFKSIFYIYYTMNIICTREKIAIINFKSSVKHYI